MVHICLNKEDFTKEVQQAKEKLVVIDFTATWCGPCRTIAPIFQTISEEYTDVVFLKVDVDENAALAEEHNVRCMPTFLFLKNGKKVFEFSGADETKLREYIQAYK